MASDPDMLVDMLTIAKGIYENRDINSLDKGRQDAAARRLNAYGILSVRAIAAVVSVSPYRVDKAIIGQARPEARGLLNPAHIGFLLYMLTLGSANKGWVHKMVGEGTSVSTIVDLTNISESTIRRKAHGGS